ncbi:MAG TPA: beta-N-acetylglucosaminidase domain-containing protein [Terriglobia bacterium]|nr:beta-N-acetylglucosaminidase domain-containing protein [Terriglobia bacterium]
MHSRPTWHLVLEYRGPRVAGILVLLLVDLTMAGPRLLSAAQATWGVVSPPGADPRLGAQLDQIAAANGAAVVPLTTTRQAKARHVSMLIELLQNQGGPESFLRTLKRSSGAAAAALTPELAIQGYVIELQYGGRSSRPQRIRITAAATEGFHNALDRLPDLVHVWPSSLGANLLPHPKALRVENGVRIADSPSFPIRGIVEGFYGAPWSHQDRLDVLRFEGDHAMNVYYYAPKDDPYHRKLWAEPYPPDQMHRLGELVTTAHANFVDFCFAISPGLSMTYSTDVDFAKLTSKLDSVAKLGVSCFALFLDDVPQDLQNPADQARFKTLAAAHVYVINKLDRYLVAQSPRNHLTVTPTTYTNAWGSRDYIKELGAGVNSHVDLVWTGTKVVSPTITVADAREWSRYLGRPPLIWDNFPVNDGIRWRLNLGPMRGRDPDLPETVSGLVSNPMNQAHASMIPLETVASYLWNSTGYHPERAEQKALLDQYDKDGAQLLSAYLHTYGDYWWQDNVFKPLFVETRRPIDTRRIAERIGALQASLTGLSGASRFSKLLPEITPFPAMTRARLAEVEADPAFKHRPDGRLVWNEDYDVIEARHLSSAPTLDGNFAKWQNGPSYVLDEPTQLHSDPKLWAGPAQFAARFALCWDAQYLYVGVDVTDPQLYQPFTGRDIEKGDVVRLTIETAFRRNFTRAAADGDEYLLLFSPGNFAGVPPSIFSEEDYLPPRPHPRDYDHDIKTAWKKTVAGFSGDIAIPVGYFDGGKFHAGYEIGLSFGARKVLPPPPGSPAGTGEEENEHISFDSKADRLFPASFGNPATYQRLVLR